MTSLTMPPFPALLTVGFRPFFLAAGLWAALAMALWSLYLGGVLALAPLADPAAWHAHALVFGYVQAAVAGFLLTATPSWTKQPTLRGWPLAWLAGLWALGRLAPFLGAPIALAALASVAMPVVLAVLITRMVVAGQNWRNLSLVAALVLLILADLLFHLDLARGAAAAQGVGLRLGLAAGLIMIAIVGGRVVPNFTRNWLKMRGATRLPAPANRFDTGSEIGFAAALTLWSLWPQSLLAALAMLAAGIVLALRLSRWCGWAVRAEPLLWVLHAAFAFLPLGALAVMAAGLAGQGMAEAQHLWSVGAVGLMTMAVMTRATLGHTGGALTAGPGTALLYGLIILAALARPFAALAPAYAPELYSLAGLAWIGAFAGFVALYGGHHLRPRPDASPDAG